MIGLYCHFLYWDLINPSEMLGKLHTKLISLFPRPYFDGEFEFSVSHGWKAVTKRHSAKARIVTCLKWAKLSFDYYVRLSTILYTN